MNDPSVWGGLILPQTLLFMDTGTYPTGVTFFSQAHLKCSAVKRKRKGEEESLRTGSCSNIHFTASLLYNGDAREEKKI